MITFDRFQIVAVVGLAWMMLSAPSSQAAGFKPTLDDCFRELANNVVNYAIANKIPEVQVVSIVTLDKSGFTYAETLQNYIKARIDGKLPAGPTGTEEPATDKVKIGDSGLNITGRVCGVGDEEAPFVIKFELTNGNKIVPDYSFFFKSDNFVKPEADAKTSGTLVVVAKIARPEEVAKLSGANNRHTLESDKHDTPGQRNEKRDERIRNERKHPTPVNTDQHIVQLKDFPEFGLKIVRKIPTSNEDEEKYEPVGVRQPAPGKPEVRLRDGGDYEIVIYNKADYAAAVDLSIDGINTMAYCEEYRDLGLWLVNANSAIQVEGFLDKIAGDTFHYHGFLATSLPLENTTVERLKESQAPGVITATFYPAWRPGENRPKIAFNQTAGAPKIVPGGKKVGAGRKVSMYFDRLTPIQTLSIKYKLGDPDDLPE